MTDGGRRTEEIGHNRHLHLDPRAITRSRTTVFGQRGERLIQDRRIPTLTGNIVGLTIAVVGIAIFAAGVVDLIDGGPDVAALLATGFVTWVVGSVMWRTTIAPPQIRVLDV